MPSTDTRVKLTKRLIDATKCSNDGEEVILRDADMPGFILRVLAGGKTFAVEKRVRGRLWKRAIGPYGAFTVEQARDCAREWIGKLLRGEDPTQDRRSLTFGGLADLYIERHREHKKSIKNDLSLLKVHLNEWRPRRLTAVTRGDVAKLHAHIGKTRPTVANAAVRFVRHLFNVARDWGLFSGENPASRISLFKLKSRDRFVRPDELPALFVALKSEPNPYIQSAFVTALLTGARKAEVLSMQWQDLDLRQSVWRIPETKPGRSHFLPLPQPLTVLLNSLPRLKGNPHVFPGRHGHGHLKNIWKSWYAIRARAGLNDVRIHDLRRTLGSWLVTNGASLPLIGKALNHSQPATTQIYARLQLDPVRDALEANAQRMLTIGGGLPTVLNDGGVTGKG